jgi:hypothetical protein
MQFTYTTMASGTGAEIRFFLTDGAVRLDGFWETTGEWTGKEAIKTGFNYNGGTAPYIYVKGYTNTDCSTCAIKIGGRKKTTTNAADP